MGQDHDREDRTESEDKFEKIERHSTEEESELSGPSRPQTAFSKELEAGFTAAPWTNNDKILQIPHPGRTLSSSTHSSQDTLEDEEHAHDHQVPSRRTPSRIQSQTRSRGQSSARSVRRDAVPVSRSERRGLLARFCLMDEVTNPYDLSRKKKWIVTAIVALAGAAAPMGSSIVLPALVDITREFDSTATIANLSVAMYMLSMSIFPLWWSSFSETLGRRSIYVVSFFLFLVFNVLAAVSVNMAMFIVMRLLAGGAAASVQAVGAGTIADVWAVKERGAAMGMFYLGPLCGPLLSPIIGGAFAQTLGWRSAQWFLAIFGAFLEVFIVFALPETLRQRKALAAEAEREAVVEEAGTDEKGNPRPGLARTTTKQSVHVKTRKYWVMARRAFIDPLRIVLYLQFPAVAVLVAYASVTFAELYVLNISVQQNFSGAPYNYGPVIVGCLYLPNSAGYFLSSIFGGRWVDRIMHREASKAGRYDANGRLVFLPEDRMKENAWLGMILYPFSLLAYGWFAQYKINVAAALVANFFFGIGSMLIFALVTTMLTEFMPRKASSGIALNNFVRNIFSCVGSVVTEPLIVAIGNGPLFSGLCVIALVAGVACMWSLKKFGPRWRIVMDQRLYKVMGD
ncbi:MFS transporter OpS2 [Pseudocercospora fuligena]|uniref:MFS transporter OpS2 n=1 Tax=Pseudocercospora fuligena TaxID=685502 RepID=A0A8H6RV80_9PEZI|nr:MFS transporter OpS2 [Pseudocercospora fuligena]